MLDGDDSLAEDIFEVFQKYADNGKIPGAIQAIPTGEVLDTDPTFIEILLGNKSVFAKPCMSFGSYNVPDKAWLDKYKDEILVWVVFENGNPAHPVYLGVSPRDNKELPKDNFPNVKSRKTVEFEYFIDDVNKEFHLNKINSDNSTKHGVKITDDLVSVSDKSNEFIIDFSSGKITVKNKSGQSLILDKQTILGKGKGTSSVILGEELLLKITELITILSQQLTNLTAKPLLVAGTAASFEPTTLLAVTNALASLTKLSSSLSTTLSSNVKID